jgi:putative flippase GtrA
VLRRLPSYSLVSLFCVLLHNAIVIALDAIGANVLVCQIASAAVLLPVGFLLQSHVTFGSERSWRNFLRYSAALITNFPLALALLWLARDWFELPMWLAAPAQTAVLFVWNYATSTWALARKNELQSR